MYSDQFTVPVHGKLTRWRLKMYPNGRKTVDQGYVTLFLKDSGREQPANLKAQVKFSVVDAMGNKINTKTIDKEYKVLNHAFGYSKFIKHQLARQAKFAQNTAPFLLKKGPNFCIKRGPILI